MTVCVIGGGVIGASVALALARREVEVTLLEAESDLCLAASATNSGILHTGFDSPPGTLETAMILRSARLRDEVLDRLGVPVLRIGASLRPVDERERAAVVELAAGAHSNGVAVELGDDGSLIVPGEAVTDPVAYTLSLAAAAERAGARIVRGARVDGMRVSGDGLTLLAGNEALARCTAAVNCAGVYADEVARAAGDESFRIYPRKGEFFVYEAPGVELSRVLLPVPSAGTKGVLVFPTIAGHVVAGPTAHDQEDKSDWSVRDGAFAEVRARAVRMVPALEGLEPVASYAGLRPAGRGVNYVIERSPVCPRLVHAAAIRSTGLSSSLGVAERVCELVGDAGVQLGPERPLEAGTPPPPAGPWWLRAAEHRSVPAS